jgi:PAS domain S-box-containing protein
VKPDPAPLLDPLLPDQPQAEEEHLRLALEAGEVGTWEWDLVSGRMHWSAQMFRNLGLAPRRRGDLYRALLRATHPADRRGLEASLAEFRQQPGPMRVEIRTVWSDGDIHWIVFLGGVVGDAAGYPVCMRGVTIDGTRRRRGEAAVHDLAERLRLAMNAGRLAALEVDLLKRVLRWSPEAAAMHGISSEQAEIGVDDWRRLIHPEDEPACAQQLAAAAGQKIDCNVEYRLMLPGHALRWLAVQGSVVLDAEERAARIVGVVQDVTERKAVEAAVRDSERRLRELNETLEQLAERRARQLDASRAQMQAFFDNSPDWLTLFRATLDGHFVYEDLNRATERAYGLSRDQVVGRRLEQILGAEPAQLPLRHMRACLHTGENQRYTARRTMAGRTRTIDVMFVRVPERQEGEFFIIATARDITEREAIEEQLRQAQKMEIVGQLTGGLAHDFNNLLTAIIGNLELLAPRLASDPMSAKHVASAQRAADSGAKLTEQLLAFSRRQHLQPQAVDLNAVISGMSDLLTRTIGTTIQVHTVLAQNLWPALIDPTQTEIAILNLAINARDAMPLGGMLTIESKNLASGSVAIPQEIRDRDCICISVRDTGTGMTEEVLGSAIEPFFTTKEVGKGSGLGLSQVYGLVRQSEGALRLESRLGAGTSVHLFLPRAPTQAGALEIQPDRSKSAASSGRILVVDDDAGVREITVQMLRQGGYGVVEVDSGQAALDALARGEVYDLVVMDIAMPGLDGIETVRRARERWPGLNVLYVTGFAEIGGAEWHTGDDPLIKKPFRLTDLMDAARLAIQRRPHRNPANILRLQNRI